jgi:hypothetical protein
VARRRCHRKCEEEEQQLVGTEVVTLDDLLNSIETVVGEQLPDLAPYSQSQYRHHNGFGVDLRIYPFAVHVM